MLWDDEYGDKPWQDKIEEITAHYNDHVVKGLDRAERQSGREDVVRAIDNFLCETRGVPSDDRNALIEYMEKSVDDGAEGGIVHAGIALTKAPYLDTTVQNHLILVIEHGLNVDASYVENVTKYLLKNSGIDFSTEQIEKLNEIYKKSEEILKSKGERPSPPPSPASPS